MFIFKTIKKGYILLYTQIILLLCILLVLIGFKLIIDQKANLYTFEKYVLNEKKDKKYKEYMLTSLNDFIKAKLVSINKEEIKNYFTLYGDKSIAIYENSNIRYSLEKDRFILTYQYEEGILKKDEYNYEVINELVKYTFKNSIFENGRLL